MPRSKARITFAFAPLVALVLFLALLGAGAANANNVPTTGARINLFPGFIGPTTYPANTAFHVVHGFGCGNVQAADDVRSPDSCLKPTTTFELFVDWRRVASITDLEIGPGGEVVHKFQISNFRNGLPAGVHVLEGQWWVDGVLTQDSVVPVTFT